MAMNPARLAKYRIGMSRRLESLQNKTEASLDFAIDHLMQERTDTYFKVEQGLTEIERALHLIAEEVPNINDLSGATRLESRLEFLEDRFEELDSEARERPRRRRLNIDFMSFFRTATGGGGDPSSPRGEIGSAFDAFKILGLEQGSTMAAVTRAFRQRAKALHPDVRKGDRTSEPELRRIIEAYQYLRENLSLS